MKQLLTIFIFLASVNAIAGHRYVSSSVGNDGNTGLDSANPYQTLTKVNAISGTLDAGDTVLFKRGDTFTGTLTTKSGTSGSPVTYMAYGAGAAPVISGLTQLTTWTLSSGNIYYADLDVVTLNLVMLDGVIKPMGRYPKTGYLAYTGHTSNTAITGAAIGTLPFDATGGEAVIRKVRYIIDRHPISSHSGSTLTLGTTSIYGGSLSRSSVDNNGFFIQNLLSCVTQEGDWFYDDTNNRVYMHFGSGTPSGRVVKVSNTDNLLTLSSKSFCTFQDIDFEGGNIYGANINGSSDLIFTNCNFRNIGQTAIYANGVTNLTVTGGSIINCLNCGVWVEQNGAVCTFEGITVTNIGTVAGSSRSGDGTMQGINVSGDSTTVKNCVITNIGYNGINFNGNDALIEKNKVDTFCIVKDDGGGIYTYSLGVTVSNRIVRNNIVLNAIGNKVGVEAYASYENFGKACAIYLDEGANHTLVQNNVLAHGEWAGVFVNNTSTNDIQDNLIYDFDKQVWLWESTSGGIRSTTVTGNTLIAKTATQKCLALKLYESDNPGLFGTFDNNVYARPIDDTNTIEVDRDYSGGGGLLDISLATWQTTYSQDASSAKSMVTITDEDKFSLDYNDEPDDLTITLFHRSKDVTGNILTGSYILPSFTGKVILQAGLVALTHSGKLLVHHGKILTN